MRILKVTYFVFGLWSIASVILVLWEIYSRHEHTDAMSHVAFKLVSSVFAAAFCWAAVYGIQKRAPIAWKLGWGVIATGLLGFLVRALRATSNIPRNEHPEVAAASVIVLGVVVAAYWGYWWNAQKHYFSKPTRTSNE